MVAKITLDATIPGEDPAVDVANLMGEKLPSSLQNASPLH
jgi:hypothetical protein